MSAGSYLGRVEPLALRSRGRSGAAVVALLIGALLALLAAAWAAALTVGSGELDRADARLATEVRSAAANFSGLVAAADAHAGALAGSPELQRALLERDRRALRRLLQGQPDLAVYSGTRLVAGTIRPPAVTRGVTVVAHGRAVGRVVGVVAVDRPLLDRLGAAAGVRPPDRLWVVSGAGARVVPQGEAFDRTTDRRYRVFGARLVDAPRPLVLEAATPRAAISDRAHRRTLWLILATLATVATLALAAWGLRSLTTTRPRETPGKRDVRQVLALVGDALASTHNPDKLLPVILHASMEATGAVAGVAIRNGELAAREGSFEATGKALRLELATVEVADEELALVLYPPPAGFDERTVALAHSLAAQAAVALDNARLHGIVQQQAVTDELTGLANRRSFRERLEAEMQRAERFDNPLALVVADLDDFKRINDRFGHQAGDEVLSAFALVLRTRIRGVDLAARLGGEEFAVLLPETDAEGAEALAESLRAAFAGLAIPVGSEEVSVTASFGVAAFPHTRGADELMTAADSALYRAKRQGKDRVVGGGP